MATSGDASSSGHNGSPTIAQPRPRRPVGKSPLVNSQSSYGLAPPVDLSASRSGNSSGTSTPVPMDAPPSVQVISSARKQIRAERKHRMFPSIEYAARVSHFDPESEYRDFRGFFVLFWVGLFIMVLISMLRNAKEHGNIFYMSQWNILTDNIGELAFSDGIMSLSIMLSLPLHKLYATSKGFFRWSKGGIFIQVIFQAAWLTYWVYWPFVRKWTWTAQVFFTLHLLALSMKMHSYAFYNGHLSETKRRLSGLDKPDGKSRAIPRRYPNASTPLSKIEEQNKSPLSPTSPASPASPGPNQELTLLREELARELTSPLGHVTYPQNLTWTNFADFLLCPTLCYELEYPRTAGIRPLELFYKSLAVFGCIFLLTVVSEEFIIPVLSDSRIQLNNITNPTPLTEQLLVLAETTSKLLFPFMVTFLLVFLVVFEYLLGAFAEMTCFADRHFYADWWNSCDWLEFSREWNIPVHHFFRRHVYSASRGANLSRPLATVITFLVSALAHELVMGCITKKLRGYGFFDMMLQMPLVMMQRTPWMKNKPLLNNVLFWCSMILGLAMMCALYVLV